MKKKIFSAAFIMACLIGGSAIAQIPATSITQEQTVPTRAKEGRKAPSPFDGIELSEKQKAELKALNEGLKAERAKIAAEEKAEKKEMKEERAKDKKEYLEKIKGILNSEQYVKFLENSYLNNSGVFGNMSGRQGMRPGKDGKMARKDSKRDMSKGRRPTSVPAAQMNE